MPFEINKKSVTREIKQKERIIEGVSRDHYLKLFKLDKKEEEEKIAEKSVKSYIDGKNRFSEKKGEIKKFTSDDLNDMQESFKKLGEKITKIGKQVMDRYSNPKWWMHKGPLFAVAQQIF